MVEEDIKKLLAEDNLAALSRIYDYVGQELYYYLAGMTGSTHDAEELLNELFIRIVDKKRQVAEAVHLKSYLYKMAANISRDHLKNNKKRLEALKEYSDFLEAGDGVPVSEAEIAKAVNALNVLPPEQKEVVVMKIYLQKSFVAIGAALNISPDTAISRYRYAMKKLKNNLEREL